MTSLNKLFSRYFIITIAIVLVIITLVSNLGGFAFFRNFISESNAEQDEKIVTAVSDMLEREQMGEASYQLVVTLLARQQQVHLILYEGENIISSSASGGLSSIYTKIRPAADIQTDPQPDYKPPNKIDSDELIYADYDIGDYRLSIGRAVDPLFDIANANFIKTLNIMYIVSFGVAMLLALGAAMILSRRFNRPIMQLRDNVNNISMNRFDKVVPCESKASEINELSDDINGLASQLKKEDEIRKRLSNDIVHELKTPIAVLSTNLEAIMDGVYSADEERMSVLLSQTNRLARLVNKLSDLTLMETENTTVAEDRVDLSDILESIHTVYLPAADDKSIKLIKDVEDGLYVSGNEDRLLQVFVNIVSNSLKYTEEGGSVTLSAHHKGDFILCEIKDTGIGISEEDLPFIFNRFYRGDESRSRDTGGSGIGLAIAKAVVAAHDGEIWAKSSRNEGTSIHIKFKRFK